METWGAGNFSLIEIFQKKDFYCKCLIKVNQDISLRRIHLQSPKLAKKNNPSSSLKRTALSFSLSDIFLVRSGVFLRKSHCMRLVLSISLHSGAKEEGVAGFFKGTGKGLVGLLVRPTGGLMDLTSGTLDFVTRFNAH